jgi:hypothetical protein
MAERQLNDLEKFVLDEVGTRTMQAAKQTGNDRLFADADGSDQNTLLSYIDSGMNKLLTYAGIVRADPAHGREVLEAGETTVDTDELLANSEQGGKKLLPQELWVALAYYVIAEWYSAVDPNLSTFWMNKYKTEAAEHRFTPGTKPWADRKPTLGQWV